MNSERCLKSVCSDEYALVLPRSLGQLPDAQLSIVFNACHLKVMMVAIARRRWSEIPARFNCAISHFVEFVEYLSAGGESS